MFVASCLCTGLYIAKSRSCIEYGCATGACISSNLSLVYQYKNIRAGRKRKSYHVCGFHERHLSTVRLEMRIVYRDSKSGLHLKRPHLAQKGRLSLSHGKPDRTHVRRLPSKPCRPAVRHHHATSTGCNIEYLGPHSTYPSAILNETLSAIITPPDVRSAGRQLQENY